MDETYLMEGIKDALCFVSQVRGSGVEEGAGGLLGGGGGSVGLQGAGQLG